MLAMMTRRYLAPFLRRSPWSWAIAWILSAGVVWAASVFQHTAQHTTKKSPEHVLDVLVAYGKVCDSGCKYYGPNVVEFIQLPVDRTSSHWFTWTYVSTTMKNVSYFSEVKLTKKSDGTFKMSTRQLTEADQALIDRLSKASKKEHKPAFDDGETLFTVTKLTDGSTKVVQAMKMTASGMLAMFGGKIEQGMKDGAQATFQNIEK